MGWKQEQIDKLLDQYLDGKLTEEEVRQMHEKLEKGELLTEAELDKIVLPIDILYPQKPSEPIIPQTPPPSTKNTYEKLEEFKQFNKLHHPIVETSKAHTLVFIVVFFTILIMTPFVYMLLPIHFNTEQLFKNNFSPYPIEEIQRDFEGSESTSSKWQECKAAYHQKNYHKTVHLLDDILQDTRNNSEPHIDHFYMGVAYLGGNEPNAAIKHFEEVLEHRRIDDWISPTHWYLALAYLQLDKTQNTRSYLKEIIAVGSEAPHYEQALKLLDRI